MLRHKSGVFGPMLVGTGQQCLTDNLTPVPNTPGVLPLQEHSQCEFGVHAELTLGPSHLCQVVLRHHSQMQSDTTFTFTLQCYGRNCHHDGRGYDTCTCVHLCSMVLRHLDVCCNHLLWLQDAPLLLKQHRHRRGQLQAWGRGTEQAGSMGDSRPSLTVSLTNQLMADRCHQHH